MHLLDLYFIAFRNHSNVTSLMATDCIYIWRWKNADYDSPIFYPKSYVILPVFHQTAPPGVIKGCGHL